MSNTVAKLAELQAQAEAVDAAFSVAADPGSAVSDLNPLRVFADVLANALFSAKALNDHQHFRSRELSVAITNLETALLWVEKAAR